MTNINSRASALIDNDGWKTYSNNRKQNQKQRQNKRLNETSQKSKNSKNFNSSNEVKINVDSNKEFPELGISKKQTKLEKRMNYLGVASHQITVEKEEPVKDGWLRIKQDKNGFVSKTYGKKDWDWGNAMTKDRTQLFNPELRSSTINSSSIKINGKDAISHGDKIKIYNPSVKGYLNKTDIGSGNRPKEEFHGWTFWRRVPDIDSSLEIYKG